MNKNCKEICRKVLLLVVSLLHCHYILAIPNIDEINNILIYDTNREYGISPGNYEIDDVNNLIQKHLDDPTFVHIYPNYNILRTHIKTDIPLTFHVGTIRKILGFKNKELEIFKEHITDYPAEIIVVNAINIYCDITE